MKTENQSNNQINQNEIKQTGQVTNSWRRRDKLKTEQTQEHKTADIQTTLTRLR